MVSEPRARTRGVRPGEKRAGCLIVCILLLCLIAAALAAAVFLLYSGWEPPVVETAHTPRQYHDAAPESVYAQAASAAPEPALEDMRYYRSLLPAYERRIYDQIAWALGEHEYNVTGIRALSEEQVDRAVEYVLLDYPEYFWANGAYSTLTTETQKDLLVDVYFDFLLLEDEALEVQARIEEKVEEILAPLREVSDYKKVKGVYEYLIENTEYDLDYVDEQDLCSVLLDGVGVCAGYARSVQYLLHCLGIECLYVTGMTEEHHAWNIVKIEGEYYCLDATWGDPQTEDGSETMIYDYVCVTGEELSRTHEPDYPELLPECTATEYNFHHQTGRYFAEYRKSDIADLLYKSASNGYRYSFKLGSEEEFADACYHLLEESDHLHDICQDIMWDYGAYSCDVWSGYNEDMYIISLEIDLKY